MTNVKETKQAADHLLEVLNERILGYKKAAEKVDDTSLKTIFKDYSKQAEDFADELIPFSDKQEWSESETSATGDMWRVWMDLKSALTGGSNDAMVKASIKGEKDAIKNFDNILKDNTNLDPELRGIVSKQVSLMKTACERLEKLKS